MSFTFFSGLLNSLVHSVSKLRPSHDLMTEFKNIFFLRLILSLGAAAELFQTLSTPSPPLKPGVFRLADPGKQSIWPAGWAGLLRSQLELLSRTTIHHGNTRAKQTAYKTCRRFKTLLHSNQKTLKCLFDISGSHRKTKDGFFSFKITLPGLTEAKIFVDC